MKTIPISEHLAKHLDEAISFWETIVNMGGHCDDTKSMTELAQFLKEEFEKLGLTCQLLDVGGGHPPLLTGTRNVDQNTMPVLFSGHYDTVFSFDTYTDTPFSIKDGIAKGPGVLDMKGGIAITWLILKVIDVCNLPVPIKILFAGDEEVDRENCNTISLLKKHAANCQFAFNMETGMVDRSVCIGRKGTEEFIITVKGISSHPGNFFSKGRNAIEEAARKIILIQDLTPEDLSYTLNVGTIHAGTVSNKIPDLCQFKVDVRFQKERDRLFIEDELRRICAMQFVPDTSTDMVSTGILPPFETHHKEEDLYRYLVSIAEKYGFPIPDKVILGGASDAAHIAETDTPVLCSMGICGENNHSPYEYAEVDSLLERASFLLHAVLDRQSFEIKE